MSFINDFVQGVASQLINTGLRKVAGNLPGMSTTTGRGNNSDMLPLAPSGNVQNYTFPLDVMADPGMGNQGHYMMFYINEQQNAKLQFGGKGNSTIPKPSSKVRDNLDELADTFGSGNIFTEDYKGASTKNFGLDQSNRFQKRVGVKRAPTRRLKTAISMYMPTSVSAGYSSQYTDTEIGIGAAAVLDSGFYDQLTSGQLGGAFSAISNFLPDVAKSIELKALGAAGMIPGFQGIRELSEMRSGVIVAERMELAFKGIDKRTFQYEFKMSPKSQEEAKEIRSIINAFKFNMLPEFEGSDAHGRSLIVPNTFDIEYMWNGAQNNFLHKISTCVLSDMSVSYGGDKFKTHAGINGDGAPPIDTTLSLTFKEMELITRERAKEGF